MNINFKKADKKFCIYVLNIHFKLYKILVIFYIFWLYKLVRERRSIGLRVKYYFSLARWLEM